MKLINPVLDDHMSPGFEGKRAGRLFQLGPGEGALDIPRSGVVPLDQVRVIAVHDPHQIGKLSGAFGMQAPANVARFPLNPARQISEVRRQAVLEQAGFDAGAWTVAFGSDRLRHPMRP